MSFANVEELWAGLKLKLFVKPPYSPSEGNKGYCYRKLKEVSRSFCSVILALPDELRDATCVFYLVLRALDSVEDDPKYDNTKKIPLLRDFHKNIGNRSFNVLGCGEKPEEIDLLQNFFKVVDMFLMLDTKFQEVIREVTQKMGNGMADFCDGKTVNTVDDYNLYCHYVAGLVGYGLTKLFIKSNCEDMSFELTKNIANSMGLFLQKTNIIRDYYEDIVQNRVFWPKDVWSAYANDIADFKDPKNIDNAVKCLNHLVTDALKEIPECLEYMSRLKKTQQVFDFCAIPQVMAIATLAEIYNNPNVFKTNVKIRKGLAAKLILNTRNIDDVGKVFNYFINKIEQKINDNDPNAALTREYIQRIRKLTSKFGVMPEGTSFGSVIAVAVVVASTAVIAYYNRSTLAKKLSSFFSIFTKADQKL